MRAPRTQGEEQKDHFGEMNLTPGGTVDFFTAV